MISTIPVGQTMRAAKRHGLRSIGSLFTDRAHGADGRLLARDIPGAVIDDSAAIALRVIRLLDGGTVETVVHGTSLRLDARSVLVHSDTPGAAQHAAPIRAAVESFGGQIERLPELRNVTS